jgi:hypothetical protein
MNTKKLLYFAMIHSHIKYFLTIYSCANTTNMNKLKLSRKQQSEFFRNTCFRDHTGPLFSQLKILPLEQLVTHT